VPFEGFFRLKQNKAIDHLEKRRGEMRKLNSYTKILLSLVIVGSFMAVLSPGFGNCEVILHDEFDGPLAPTWTIQTG
jgi:hypothetical protein